MAPSLDISAKEPSTVDTAVVVVSRCSYLGSRLCLVYPVSLTCMSAESPPFLRKWAEEHERLWMQITIDNPLYMYSIYPQGTPRRTSIYTGPTTQAIHFVVLYIYYIRINK